MSHRRITANEAEQMYLAHQDGDTIPEIAHHWDVSVQTVYNHLAARGRRIADTTAPATSSADVDDPTKPWDLRAACRDHTNRDDFYPESAANPVEKNRRKRAAKKVCHSCPVINDCLRDALSRNDNHGIWGGLTPTERFALTNRQPRAASA